MNMNAVGLDASKRKSPVDLLHLGRKFVVKPFDVPHLADGFHSLISLASPLMAKHIVMECTGHYYELVARQLSQAGFFVSTVNFQIICNFQGQDNPLRRVKTDKADSVKIVRYTLDSWAKLKQCSLIIDRNKRGIIKCTTFLIIEISTSIPNICSSSLLSPLNPASPA